LALDEPEEDERSIEINGINVLVSEGLENLVDGTKIDYVVQPEGEGFVMTGRNNSC
jgi:Fe-S cluster assembly iron-binding protein IscA